MIPTSTQDDVVDISRVFQRGKTVIPSEVRSLLGVSDGDKVVWQYDKLRGIIYIQVNDQKLVRFKITG